MQQAVKNRLELVQTTTVAEREEIALQLARNQILPKINLEGA